MKAKYSTVLKVEGKYVYGQDGVSEQLRKGQNISSKSSRPKDQATISMTISINDVDQEVCGHFFWDIAQKAIRDKFKFDFGAASNALHSNQTTIMVDELDAHRTIVMRTFKYLDQEPREKTKKIGDYLVCWLPWHLGRLRQLEDEEKGSLKPDQKLEIGQNLYNLFKDERVFRRHRGMFERCLWWVEDMVMCKTGCMILQWCGGWMSSGDIR